MRRIEGFFNQNVNVMRFLLMHAAHFHIFFYTDKNDVSNKNRTVTEGESYSSGGTR